jgi:hypothetical protein
MKFKRGANITINTIIIALILLGVLILGFLIIKASGGTISSGINYVLDLLKFRGK